MAPLRNVYRFRSRPDIAPPAVQIDIDKPGQEPGFIFLDSQGGIGDEGPMIVDGSGEPVWFRAVSANPHSLTNRAFNVRPQTYRGRPVLTWFDGSVAGEHGSGENVMMDSAYNEIARVGAGEGDTADLHEFLLTPQGTALLTAYPLAYGDLSAVGGGSDAPYVYGAVQEIDVASGDVLLDWRSDQHTSFAESYAPMVNNTPWDYFHVNSIDVMRDDSLLISARCTWTVYKVDRHSGDVRWRLGGKHSDFALGPGARFTWQHDVNQQSDGALTVFDNGAGDYRSEPVSRALVLEVNERTRRASVKRQLVHPRYRLQAGALGSVQTLPAGHLFVGWGLNGAFSEFAADGTPLLDGRIAGEGVQSYRAFRSAWSAVPAEPPALAVAGAGSTITLFASWNGATGVAEWVVLGGMQHSALSAIGRAPRQGFETVIHVPRHPAFVAVLALDSTGRELGRSRIHTT